jgi:hypothetical protein
MTDEEWWQGRWKLNEAEWLACTNPGLMLRFLRGRASDRKVRLFACHCCRRVWQYLVAVKSRHAVEIAEQFADGLASLEELITAHATPSQPEAQHW